MNELDALLEHGFDQWSEDPVGRPRRNRSTCIAGIYKTEAALLAVLFVVCLASGGWYDSEAHPDVDAGNEGSCRGDHVGLSRLLFIVLLSCLALAIAVVCYRAGRRAVASHRVRLIIHMRPLSPSDWAHAEYAQPSE